MLELSIHSNKREVMLTTLNMFVCFCCHWQQGKTNAKDTFKVLIQIVVQSNALAAPVGRLSYDTPVRAVHD